MPNAREGARRAGRVAQRALGLSRAQREGAAREDATHRPLSTLLARACRQAAAAGCVLLENDGVLPLDPKREVAVFGRCQVDWQHMGHGSGGDVRAPYLTNLLDGMEELGVRYNRLLAELYRAWSKDSEHAAPAGIWGLWPQSLPEMEVTPEMARAAAATAEVAVVVIARNAGEDQDLVLKKGGYYLTDDERKLLATVTEAFERVVVVVNAANLIDLAWREAYGSIGAVLLAHQGGMEAGHAVADVLWGRISPTGHLSATIARTWEDHPSSKSFGKRRRVDYAEGVFVGYRHFDTRAPERVLYPFGHGLTYTTFSRIPFALEREGGSVVSRVEVTNTGTHKAADVLLLWCVLAKGALAKPAKVLAAFARTRELEPGESQEMALSFDLRTVASFNEDERAWVLEGGTYELFVGTDAAGSFDIADTLVIERHEHLCQSSAELRCRILERMPNEIVATGDRGVSFTDVASGEATLEAFVAGLSDEELARLTSGEGMMDSDLGPSGNAGAFGGVTEQLRAKQIPAAICADGPSGIRLDSTQTLLPSATTLASTFDVSLVERLYFLLGQEALSAGVDVLLAPAMNIQRNPRCGRNFEYFSEDPLLTGRMGAAVVRGLTSAGVACCPKHLAANNQERARTRQDSRVSERALREIYLRGFEICVSEARPPLMMVAYNRLNGIWCHYHYDLATSILRGEWGFTGVTVTDWWMRRAASPEFEGLRDNGYRIRAGVDVLMPGNLDRMPLRHARDRSALGASRSELQRSALHILSFLLPLSYRRAREQELRQAQQDAQQE